MTAAWQDIRFTFRLLRPVPGLAILAIVSLGVAIAANTTIFSVIYTVMLARSPLSGIRIAWWSSGNRIRRKESSERRWRQGRFATGREALGHLKEWSWLLQDRL